MKKVAAYARVSTNKRNQETSFQYQSDYWNEVLTKNDDYEYVGLFADKGISGKYATRRPQFMALIEEAERGNIDIIFTKSVQRFARNTEELLSIVKKLREKGIAIIFEKENINSLNTNSELCLTIAAALAEEDLANYSTNIKWTIQDKFKNGENVMGYIIYGYNVLNNKELIINEEQAKVVKEIYTLYATGNYSSTKIAKTLNEKNIPSAKGVKWTDGTIRNILRNEKYKGDLMLQKFYSEKGKRLKNRGERDMYYVQGNHEAIISEELWNKVQKIFERRSAKKLVNREQVLYPFTSLIRCGKCGETYQHKIANSGTSSRCEYYSCSTNKKYGIKACGNHAIKAEVINALFIEAYNDFVDNKYLSAEIIRQELEGKFSLVKELNQLLVKGFISKENYEIEQTALKKEIALLESSLTIASKFNSTNNNNEKITKFDESIVHKYIKEVTILDWMVIFVFYNGAVITKHYTNGHAGNKEIWKLAGGKKCK